MIKGLFDAKRWNAMFQAFPEYYIPGFLMTLKISLVGLAVALALGVIFGMFSTAKFKLLRILSRIYVEFIQNTPLALQVLCYYSVLPMLFSSSGFRILIRARIVPKNVLIRVAKTAIMTVILSPFSMKVTLA